METIIKVRPSELNVSFLEKLQQFLKGNDNYEITIQVAERPSAAFLRSETQEQYKARLDKSIYNIERGEDLVTFSFDEFVKLSKSL